MFAKTMIDGTRLCITSLPGTDNDALAQSCSTEPGNRVDVLLSNTDQAVIIARMLSRRRAPTVEDADALAAALHAGQQYGDQPYIVHPRDVARRVEANGRHAIMAALLHDTVEDTGITAAALRALGYPALVVYAVDAVTRRKHETYAQFIDRAAMHPLGRIIKLADNASNTANLHNITDVARREGLRTRYAKARTVLFAAGSR